MNDAAVLAALAGPLDALWRGLREGLAMFWETLWALALGFALSGAVQAFVSREDLQRVLGTHGPAAVARAAGLGAASSSCSYAASAMAKSLFQKGADFVSAMVFMVASTNLVVELGLVMLVLLGWQFTVAEFAGGPLMVVLLALVGGLVLRGPVVEAARRRLAGGAGGEADGAPVEGAPDSSTSAACARSSATAPAPRAAAVARAVAARREAVERAPWGVKLRSRGAWADAASYAVADVTMLRKELVVGYGVAGFLAALVPPSFWAELFVRGHGPWTALENAAIGPVIAFLSFVCSVGNVPLAAALWKGGISFGGVVSFIFADLVSMPLVLVYRRLYGARLTVRLVLVLYVVMATAGLVVGAVFGAAGLVPRVHRAIVTSPQVGLDHTTVLDVIALVAFGGLYWMSRHREQLGGGAGLAFDPVCGMVVRVADAPAVSLAGGHEHWFCSDRCRKRFDEDPARFATVLAPAAVAAGRGARAALGAASPDHEEEEDMTASRGPGEEDGRRDPGVEPAVDPVCHMTVEPAHAAAHRQYEGKDYWFCNTGCAAAFDADPERYL